VFHVKERFNVSERGICRVLSQPRSTQRYLPRVRDGEALLTERMIGLATKYGRYGYRRITALLQREGFQVNHKRVERLWRREGLKVPLGYLFIYRGLPGFIRSDNGPEFTANGWNDWVFKLCLLNRVVPGRMDTMNRLMENLEMSY